MINSFSGQHAFLSNFYKVDITYEGLTYPSVEHAYMAQKTLNMLERQLFTDPGMAAGQAKKLGRTLQLRPDWESVKVIIMANLLAIKFTHKELRDKLLATGDEMLVEGNWWNDTFWGVCKGVGLNQLGLLLMELRTAIRNG
jgi:hypothetical protein